MEPDWTPQHDAYCLERGITPSAKLLWQWLIRRNSGLEQEPDLAEFNSWIEKHRGKGYHRDTLKAAIAQLIEHKVIEPLKKFTWRIWRIVLRPINAIICPPKLRKKSHTCECVRDPGTSNPQFAADDVQTTTTVLDDEDLAAKVEVCRQAGIRYMGRSASFLRDFTLDEINKASTFFFASGANNRDKVPNPEGWFRACLRDDYVGQHERRRQEDSDEYYSPKSSIAKRQALEWERAGRPLGQA